MTHLKAIMTHSVMSLSIAQLEERKTVTASQHTVILSIAILAQYLPIKTTAGKQEADEEQNMSVTKEAAGIVAKYLTVQQENQETPAT
ncbi:uncharacterized protein SEPMUDRAFT_116773 [Sphaerulina musiva SO2202]|uniref:Uncharacterized protein n=1 Tax=Sphaerulina musiva (strain SO2202) TaxID=692275 RepID=M3D6F5_SPHMS|nr:uncharacterized protein SEPMUDRAFT_116773 [Sphaerulina musiva SO2202]EMF13755.1 hypothetical protein SEPMUDRAFT_116773 [Sphaerulina musiva SO2202]